MPHHPADGFNGYTITEANERGKTMPGHVEGQMTSQFALFFYHLQAAAQTAGCRLRYPCRPAPRLSRNRQGDLTAKSGCRFRHIAAGRLRRRHHDS